MKRVLKICTHAQEQLNFWNITQLQVKALVLKMYWSESTFFLKKLLSPSFFLTVMFIEISIAGIQLKAESHVENISVFVSFIIYPPP